MSATPALLAARAAGRHLSMTEKRLCEQALAAGPWLSAAPEKGSAPGVVLLLVADDDHGGASALVWDAHPALPTTRRPAQVAFGPESSDALGAAWRALSEGLPMRWGRFAAPLPRPEPAQRLLTWRRPDVPAIAPADTVDGPSFGLAFALGLASASLEISVAPDVCALAAISTDGAVTPVGGLAAKLGIVAHLPALRRLLVAPEQAAEVEVQLRQARPEAPELQVVPVRSVAEAVERALEMPPAAAISALTDDPSRREAWVEALFRLCLDGHDRVRHWPPLARAAAAAEQAFADRLDPEARWRLQLASAIAHRHGKQARPLPDLAPLLDWPLPRRLLALAHAVQHAADVGAPDVATLSPTVLPLLRDGDDAFEPHCRLAGAWGRLLAAQARPHDALRWQRFAVEQRLRIGAEVGISQPLAEMLRLGGLCRDPAAVAEARAAHTRATGLEAIRDTDRPYLALADALATAGLSEPGAAEVLRSLLTSSSAPLHVRLSAARHLLRLRPEDATAASWLAGANVPAGAEGHVRLFSAISGLDAVAAGAASEAEVPNLIACARKELPGTLAHLEQAAADAGPLQGRALAVLVADHFPY